MRPGLLVSLLLLAMLLPTDQVAELEQQSPEMPTQGRAAFTCSSEITYDSSTDLPVDSALLGINDQDCAAIWLEGFIEGDVIRLTLNVSAGMIDALMMDSGVFLGYLNEQPYLENPLSGSPLTLPHPSFENLSGIIDFHWTVPSTETWILVLDNMRHASDDDRGAGGGAPAVTVASIAHDSETWPWQPLKSVFQTDSESHVIANDDALVFDEGDVITLRADPLFGNPDVYLMTGSQLATYLSGSPGEWRIDQAELTDLTVSDQIDWTVTSEFAGLDIHLILDARSTPAGGGDGANDVAATLSVLVSPAISPVITIVSHASNSILLGETLNLDSSSTANRWSQIASYSWMIDDNPIQNSSVASAQWDSPGNYTVNLTATRVDGQSNSVQTTIDVVDDEFPSVGIIGLAENAFVEQGDSISITCYCDDNHLLASVNWYWDGVMVDDGGTMQLSMQLDTTVIGSHHLRIAVADPSGNSVEVERNLTVGDASDPVITSVIWPEDGHLAGTMLSFSLSAIDAESPDVSIQWDFDLNVDSDKDGDKRNDWVAADFDTARVTGTAEHTYDAKGVYTVLVQVVNSEGRKVELTHTVVVDSPPAPESPQWLWGLGAVMVIIALGAGGFFGWTQLQLRIARLEEEGRHLTQDQRDDIERKRVVENLYGDSQASSLSSVAAMPAASGSSGWERPQSAAQSYESIAGLGAQTQSQPAAADVGQDMLDALVDEPVAQSQPASQEMDDLSFLDDLKEPVSKPAVAQPTPQKSSLAIDVPGLDQLPAEKPKGGLKIDIPTQSEQISTVPKIDDLDL